MKFERLALYTLLTLVLVVPTGLLSFRWWETSSSDRIEIRARMPENGGWTPADLTVAQGETIHLRLTSDDVLHSFAIGKMDAPPTDIYPGKWTDLSLTFDQPGKYTFYCTRWCGSNHWRMRGIIEVHGEPSHNDPIDPPLYIQLGLDIDAPHPASFIPARRPDASRGEALQIALPLDYLDPNFFRSHSPAEIWQILRNEEFTIGLSDLDVWDLVALLWSKNTNRELLAQGSRIYAEDCAACHGELGRGDGVMAGNLIQLHDTDMHQSLENPSDFTDPVSMLGASPAILHGKIVRGGMGTGMPYWGPIFNDDQFWAVIDFLYSFQFDWEEHP
jgi:mono/diheme cytochrome c family protein/plastocyanin